MEYLSDFIKFLQSTKNLSKKTLNAYSIDLNQYFKYEKIFCIPIFARLSHFFTMN